MVEQNEVAATVEAIENNVSEASTVYEAYNDRDIHAIVSEEDIGAFYGAVRQTGAEPNMFRDGDQIRGFINL